MTNIEEVRLWLQERFKDFSSEEIKAFHDSLFEGYCPSCFRNDCSGYCEKDE